MNNNIVYVDLFSVKNFHEKFNASVLLSLVKKANENGANISIFATKSSFVNSYEFLKTKGYLEETPKIEFNEIKLPHGTNSLYIFLRHLVGFFFGLGILFKFSKNHTIIFSQLNPFLAFFFKFNIKFNSRILIICHGELEFSISKSPITKPLFLYSLLINRFLKGINFMGCQIIVLGDSIKANLQHYFKDIHLCKVISIDHPYFYEHKDISNEECLEIRKVGIVGAISNSKGFLDFVDFSYKLRLNPFVSKISVVGIGRHNYNVCDYTNIEFAFKRGYFATHSEFNIEVAKLDVILFFYNMESYKLTCSGALFDAVNHNKIVISLRNDYFDYMFNKYGPIGVLCNSVDEMIQALNNIVCKKIDIKIFHENMSIWRENTSSDNFSLPS
ncbi:hypothetical protein [Sphingobacterium sp. xlx-130]|uniref:hypothetical protein n=1 Tax=Sphingobacterium sp. xlx-130 TaxID=2654323 RepID=UPI0013DBF167|nr:hypothetical protein [Sphingobacterium sp. xlx-130]